MPSSALRCAVEVLRLFAMGMVSFCLVAAAGAASPPGESDDRVKEEEPYPHEFRSITDWTILATRTHRAESSLNPANRVAEIPSEVLQTFVKEDFRWLYRTSTKIVFRPFLLAEKLQIEQGPHLTEEGRSFYKDRSQISVTDAYWEQLWTERLATTLGIQQYQWGPGELISPSNPFFHFNSQSQSFFNLVKGRFLLRVNHTQSEHSTAGLILEPLNNGSANWIADKPFSEKGLFKWDWQFSNPANYISVLAGQVDEHIPFLASYFNWSPTEGISFYADGRGMQGNRAYYPQIDGGQTLRLLENADRRNELEWLALTGMRSETEVWDIRMEYLYNSMGWTKDQEKQSMLSTHSSNRYAGENLKHLNASGRELPGRHYLYLSFRFPNLGLGFGKKEKNLALRYLHSLQDQSGSAQFAVDGPLSGNVVWNFQFQASRGPDDSELRIFEDYSGIAGMTSTW